uniref:Glycine N-acyltransferase-like protein n=1 Tax=Arion vulgaris TaxID=1028688 RepID=A0A0B6ZQS6_9EUPU
MVEIHQVSEHELPILLQWLKEHLPLTWKLYGTLREQLRGKWQGTTFCTLGWPDILAVGEGPINEDICKVVGHYTDPRRTTVFAPEPAHARDFLTWPGFIDWSQPVIFHMLSLPVASIIKTLSQQAGCPSPKTIPLTLLTANSGDIKYRDGTCLGAEMGTEWGFIGMLYVTSSARGRGLGKLLTCRLAEKYFEEDLPAVVVTSVDNTESICLHESLGFQQECQLNLMYHTPDNINK